MPTISPPRATLLAALCGAGVGATYAALVRTGAGRRLEEDAVARAHRRAGPASRRGLDHYDEMTFALAATTLGLTGLVVRGPVRTACAGVALLGTVGQAELLKAVLPRPGGKPNTFPSGHTAGIAGLAAMAGVLAPGHAPVIGWGGAVATGVVGAATVAARWHRPSDVVGAALTAVGWGAVSLAAADVLDPR